MVEASFAIHVRSSGRGIRRLPAIITLIMGVTSETLYRDYWTSVWPCTSRAACITYREKLHTQWGSCVKCPIHKRRILWHYNHTRWSWVERRVSICLATVSAYQPVTRALCIGLAAKLPVNAWSVLPILEARLRDICIETSFSTIRTFPASFELIDVFFSIIFSHGLFVAGLRYKCIARLGIFQWVWINNNTIKIKIRAVFCAESILIDIQIHDEMSEYVCSRSRVQLETTQWTSFARGGCFFSSFSHPLILCTPINYYDVRFFPLVGVSRDHRPFYSSDPPSNVRCELFFIFSVSSSHTHVYPFAFLQLLKGTSNRPLRSIRHFFFFLLSSILLSTFFSRTFHFIFAHFMLRCPDRFPAAFFLR